MALVPKKTVTNQKRLYDWIRRNAYTPRPEGSFIAIRVHQIHNKSKVGDEVGRFDIPPQDERHESWDADLTAEILSQLQVEASQFGGMQHYACYSVYDKVPDENVNRCVVAIHGIDNEDEDELLSEPPNATGLVAQSMRHQEANARIMTGGIMQVIGAQGQQISKLMEMNTKLLDTHMAMTKDMTDMWEERRNSILATQMQELKAHGIKEGIDLLKQIGPVIVNQIAGKEVLPVDTRAGVTALAKSFYGSLTADQVEALKKVLRQDQLIPFFEMGETLVGGESDETNGKD